MVLPCIIYGAEEKLLRAILAAFQEASADYGVAFQVAMNTNSYEAAEAIIDAAPGIFLLISYIQDVTTEEGKQALKLCHKAVHSNRDNYVVYCAADSKTLVRMASACIRPAGVLQACSFGLCSKRMFREICEDYRSLHEEESPADAQWLQVRSHGTLSRIRISDICMVQSNNKQVDFHTLHGVLTGSGTLENLEKELPEKFVRCHRTCIINIECIQYIDYKQMLIIMMDGTEVPLARSSRKTVDDQIAMAGKEG